MHSVVTTFVYPAILTALGVTGNAYILGSQIKELGSQVKELGAQVKDVKGVLKEVKHDVKALVEMELHDMTVAEKLLRGCDENKRC